MHIPSRKPGPHNSQSWTNVDRLTVASLHPRVLTRKGQKVSSLFTARWRYNCQSRMPLGTQFSHRDAGAPPAETRCIVCLFIFHGLVLSLSGILIKASKGVGRHQYTVTNNELPALLPLLTPLRLRLH